MPPCPSRDEGFAMLDHLGNTAPYAPIKNVLSVINHRRDHGLPAYLTKMALQSIGVPEGNSARTLAALRFLGLVDIEGEQTEAFHRLGRANQEEFPAVLAEILHNSYRPVFLLLDPSSSTDVKIHDTFRQYGPDRQRHRMVRLFLGLCRAAAIISESSTKRAGTPSSHLRHAAARGTDTLIPTVSGRPARDLVSGDHTDSPKALDYRLLSSVLEQLPTDGVWTEDQRERWLKAITATVDLLIETAPMAQHG